MLPCLTLEKCVIICKMLDNFMAIHVCDECDRNSINGVMYYSLITLGLKSDKQEFSSYWHWQLEPVQLDTSSILSNVDNIFWI